MANLRIVLTCLPVLWVPLFSFPEFAGSILVGLFLLGRKYWTSDQESSGTTLIRIGLNAAFLSILYAPILKLSQVTWLVPAVLILISIVIWIIGLPSLLKWEEGSTRTLFMMSMVVIVTLLIGGVPTFLLFFSPLDPPTEMVPLAGWLTAAWTLFFWGSLCVLFLSKDSVTERGRHGIALLCVVLIGGVSLYRSVGIEKELKDLVEDSTADISIWEDLLYRARSLQVPGQEDRVLVAALESLAFTNSDSAWVSWAKELDRGEGEFLATFPVNKCLLAIGGRPWEGEFNSEQETCVALEIDPDSYAIHMLTDSGYLSLIDDAVSKKEIESEVGPFVHMCLGSKGESILLEAGGRVLSVSGEDVTEVIPTHFSKEAAFLIRIARDPKQGIFWVMDRFGVLYRSDLNQRSWIRDDRFLPYAKTPDGAYPTAQDIAISEDGILHFLNCYGEIWASSTESQTVEGRDQGAHYFPDFPVAQSIGVHGETVEIVDRYGGFYPSPYPTDYEILQLRNSHLFPRSLPRRDPEVVDHVFLPEHRWLYLLTKSGRILTNRKWHSYWAR